MTNLTFQLWYGTFNIIWRDYDWKPRGWCPVIYNNLIPAHTIMWVTPCDSSFVLSFFQRHQTNWRVMYENLPQKASTYRGRILMSREIRDELPLGREEVNDERFNMWNREGFGGMGGLFYDCIIRRLHTETAMHLIGPTIKWRDCNRIFGSVIQVTIP